MGLSSLFDRPSSERLPQLLKQISAGEILVPRFQRPFVWTDEQRLRLLDSIRSGIPIGSLLLWRTAKHKLAVYPKLGPFPVSIPDGTGLAWRQYLLDGHQRLATLYGALNPGQLTEETEYGALDPGQLTEEGNGAGEASWPIYFDLEEELFRLAGSADPPPLTWLPLSLLFSRIALYRFLRRLDAAASAKDAGKRAGLVHRAEELAERFMEYAIPVVPFFSEDLTLAIDAFQRINLAGTPMSEVHMASAMTWTADFDLDERLQAFVDEELSPLGWGLDVQDVLEAAKALFALRVYKSRPEDLGRLVANRSHLDEVARCLQDAVTFLHEECGVSGPALLPYRHQLIALAAAFHQAKARVSTPLCRDLVRWFWLTTYHQYFAGMVERGIHLAIEHMRQLAQRKAKPEPPGLRQAGEVASVGVFRFNEARGKATTLQLLRRRPLDAAGALLTETISGAEGIPKILLAAQLRGPAADGPENRWIAPPRSVKALRTALFHEARSDAALWKSHFIPSRALHALRRGSYEEFLALRRRALATDERAWLATI